MDRVSSDRGELRDKLVRLTDQLEEAEGLKKSAVKGFNDQIRDLKAEIKMTLQLLKEADNA